MATPRIDLTLDEDLVRRVRQQDTAEANKNDRQIIEDALALFLGLHALDEARAQRTLETNEANRLAVREVSAVRRTRRQSS